MNTDSNVDKNNQDLSLLKVEYNQQHKILQVGIHVKKYLQNLNQKKTIFLKGFLKDTNNIYQTWHIQNKYSKLIQDLYNYIKKIKIKISR